MTTIEMQQQQYIDFGFFAKAISFSTANIHTRQTPAQSTKYTSLFSSQQCGTLHTLSCPYLARLSLVAFTFPLKFTRSHIKYAITRAHFDGTHQHK